MNSRTCFFCGGAAHPSTGAVYSARVLACGPCVRSFFAWARDRMRIRYEVLSLDVWGNARDGFYVNEVHRTGIVLECTAVLKHYNVGRAGEFYQYEPADKYVVRALKRAGLLKRGVRVKSLEIDGENDATLYVNERRTGEPLWHLECLEPEKLASVVVTPWPTQETGT